MTNETTITSSNILQEYQAGHRNFRGAGLSGANLEAVKKDFLAKTERWFLGIRPGDTPEMSWIVRTTLAWLDEWKAGQV